MRFAIDNNPEVLLYERFQSFMQRINITRALIQFDNSAYPKEKKVRHQYPEVRVTYRTFLVLQSNEDLVIPSYLTHAPDRVNYQLY